MNRFTFGVILCLQVAASAQDTFKPVRDTYVTSAQPDSSYFWEVYLSAEEDAVSLHERLYIKFDTSTLAGKTITAATVRLKVLRENGGGAFGDNYELFGVTSPWEDQLTWNQAQSVTVGPLVKMVPSVDYGALNDVDPPQAVDFDVTALAQSWADGAANEGIMVRLAVGAKADIRFGSKESLVNQPQLIVTSSAAAPAPSPAPSTPLPPAGPDTKDNDNGDGTINDKCGCGTASTSSASALVLALGLLLLRAARRP